jgi:hypothetical protein
MDADDLFNKLDEWRCGGKIVMSDKLAGLR